MQAFFALFLLAFHQASAVPHPLAIAQDSSGSNSGSNLAKNKCEDQQFSEMVQELIACENDARVDLRVGLTSTGDFFQRKYKAVNYLSL